MAVTEASCASLEPSDVVDRDVRLSQLSLTLPDGEWHPSSCAAGEEGFSLQLSRTSSDDHSFVMAVLVTPLSPEEGSDVVREDWLTALGTAFEANQQREFEQSSRWENLDLGWRKVDELGGCMRSWSSRDDVGVPGRSGDRFVQLEERAACLGPGNPPPFIVVLAWSERTPPDEDGLDAGARRRLLDRVLDSVEVAE